MSSSIGISWLLIVLVLVIGFVGLVVALLANRRTRVFGAVSLALCVLAGVGLFASALVMTGMRTQNRVQAEVREMSDLRREVERTRLQRQLDELNRPRIDLDSFQQDLEEFAKAEPINDPGLQLVSEAPDWGERPKADYDPGSDFVKEIAAERKADWVIIKRPQSERGIEHCLALERWAVRDAVRRYVATRSKRELDDDARLGMSDLELYKRFVVERQLIVKDGEHTIYTMIVVRNNEGGDELLAKTLALAKPDGVAQVVVNQRTGETADFDSDTPMSEVAEAIETADVASAPEWVTNPPKRVGETVRLVLKSGPYTTVDECRVDADGKLVAAADRAAHGMTLILGEGAVVAPPPAYLRLHELRRRTVRDEHVETVDASFGEMKTLHTLVEISPADGRWLVEQRQLAEQSERLGQVGFFAAVVLGLLGAAFGLLKTDELTRGYYSKRLFIGVPLVILAMALLTLLLLPRSVAANDQSSTSSSTAANTCGLTL